MLSSYYYILSSLPYLDLRGGDEYSLNQFFNNVSVPLKEEDFNFLKNLEIGKFEKGKSKIIDALLSFEETIRYTLAYIRAEKLGISRDIYAESQYFSTYYLSILKSIASKDNPFEVDLGFDMLKWQYLSDLEVGHDFDFEKLVIYFLKLVIVVRRNSFEEKLGRENFDLICENLIKEISQKV